VTEEMAHVAGRERLDPALVLAEVARGRMIIPANRNHPELEPMAIGVAATCKINANIGRRRSRPASTRSSASSSCACDFGADTVISLSTTNNGGVVMWRGEGRERKERDMTVSAPSRMHSSTLPNAPRRGWTWTADVPMLGVDSCRSRRRRWPSVRARVASGWPE